MSTFVLKIADRFNLDKLGISTSLLCAIHCAVVPIVPLFAGIVGVDIIWSHEFEILMIALAIIIGIWSLVHGFIHAHRNFLPFTIFAIGVAIIFASKVWVDESQEFWVLPIGALFLIIAHWKNWRMHKHCSAMPGHQHSH